MKRWMFCALVLLVLTLSAQPLGAHAEMIASTPEAGAVVNDLSEISVKLIAASEATVTLFGPDGSEVAPTSATRMQQLDAVRSFRTPTTPGRYEVRWQAVGIDNDVAEGRFSLTLDPDASESGDLSGAQTALGLLITSVLAVGFFLVLIRRGRVRG